MQLLNQRVSPSEGFWPIFPCSTQERSCCFIIQTQWAQWGHTHVPSTRTCFGLLRIWLCCFCQMSQSRLREKWGRANLGSNHASRTKESSNGRPLWTTAVFQNKGVVGRKPLLLHWELLASSVHQLTSQGWTMDHSEGMNEPIYNGDTQAERKCLYQHPHHTSGCDVETLWLVKWSFHNLMELTGNGPYALFEERERMCDNKLIWVGDSNICYEHFHFS